MEAVIPSDPSSITGKPPRLSPLSTLEGDAADVWSELGGGREPGITAGVLLRHPALYEPYYHFSRTLMDGKIQARTRELAILRLAWLLQSPFAWGEHVLIGKSAGITSEEIERVTEGADAQGWDDQERTILRAVEEIHRDAVIGDETWARLTSFLSDEQLIELPILVGWYACVAVAYNSLRMPLRPENPGLAAR